MPGRVVRASERPTKPAPPDWFGGTVFLDEVVVGERPSRLRATVSSFAPGGRTAWHSHPVGQTLYCLTGIGRICFEGEAPQVLRPGDTVLIPPETRHWHGAAPDRLFSHLAMMEVSDAGAGTAWAEHVSDAEYTRDATDG